MALPVLWWWDGVPARRDGSAEASAIETWNATSSDCRAPRAEISQRVCDADNGLKLLALKWEKTGGPEAVRRDVSVKLILVLVFGERAFKNTDKARRIITLSATYAYIYSYMYWTWAWSWDWAWVCDRAYACAIEYTNTYEGYYSTTRRIICLYRRESERRLSLSGILKSINRPSRETLRIERAALAWGSWSVQWALYPMGDLAELCNPSVHVLLTVNTQPLR